MLNYSAVIWVGNITLHLSSFGSLDTGTALNLNWLARPVFVVWIVAVKLGSFLKREQLLCQ